MVAVCPLPIRVAAPNGDEFIYPTVIKTPDELILVDAGYPGQADDIFTAAAREGFDLKRLTKIVLTHHDFDHVGSLHEIKKRCPKATVLAPAKEASFIEGKEKPFRLQQAEAVYASLPEEAKKGAKAFEGFLKSITPCGVDGTVKDGDAVDEKGNLLVIETPGHTAGHISLFLPSGNTVIAGDALVWENGELALANPHYAFNLEQAKASAEKLWQMNPAVVICYHGGACAHPKQTRLNL